MKWISLIFVFSCLTILPVHSSENTSAHMGHAPVIFAHGLLVPYEVYDDFSYIKTIFSARNYDFFVAQTPVNKTIEERAKVLAEEIKRLVPTGPFHLIGHSMGGLDARLAIKKYGLGDRCLSLTTVATPHHGSLVAKWIYQALKKEDGTENKTSENDINGSEEYLENHLILAAKEFYRHTKDSLSQLTPEFLDEIFNVDIENDPRVKYFSLSFYTPWPFYFYSTQISLAPTHELLLEMGQDNDGLVSVESSRWGKSLGVLMGDHIAETFPGPFSGTFIYPRTFLTIIDNLDNF